MSAKKQEPACFPPAFSIRVVKDITPRVMPGDTHAKAAAPLLASQKYSVFNAPGGPPDGSWVCTIKEGKHDEVLGWIPSHVGGKPTFEVITEPFSSKLAKGGGGQKKPADVRLIEAQVTKALKAMGGVYATYSCRRVSWEDASRGMVGGKLSVLGANITDVTLNGRDGTSFFTVRPPNFVERLGVVTADQLACVYNNCVDPAVQLTVGDFVRNIGSLGNYAGLDLATDLSAAVMPGRKMTVRFQTVFLPVAAANAPVEFCASAYNYQTRSEDDPKNLLLLCMADGTFVETDGPGQKKMMLHRVSKDDGILRRCWLSAKATRFAVGEAQVETSTEKKAAKARGESTAMFVGPKAAGARVNMFMTVQIPLKQAPRPTRSYSILTNSATQACAMEDYWLGDEEEECCSMGLVVRMPVGKTTAARVSVGSEHSIFRGVKKPKPTADLAQHPTATVVIYHTVEGGVPSAEDVRAAIDDMEHLLKACNGTTLKDLPFGKSELTVKQLEVIHEKITADPPGAKLDKLPPSPRPTSYSGPSFDDCSW